jgi:hypothetical protein
LLSNVKTEAPPIALEPFCDITLPEIFPFCTAIAAVVSIVSESERQLVNNKKTKKISKKLIFFIVCSLLIINAKIQNSYQLFNKLR